jgi:hypothetical protein
MSYLVLQLGGRRVFLVNFLKWSASWLAWPWFFLPCHWFACSSSNSSPCSTVFFLESALPCLSHLYLHMLVIVRADRRWVYLFHRLEYVYELGRLEHSIIYTSSLYLSSCIFLYTLRGSKQYNNNTPTGLQPGPVMLTESWRSASFRTLQPWRQQHRGGPPCRRTLSTSHSPSPNAFWPLTITLCRKVRVVWCGVGGLEEGQMKQRRRWR